MQDRGRESYLSVAQRQEVEDWLGAQETTVEEGRDESAARSGIVYQSKQSYDDVMEAGGVSYHRTEKGKPRRTEAQGRERREEMKKNWRRAGARASGAR